MSSNDMSEGQRPNGQNLTIPIVLIIAGITAAVGYGMLFQKVNTHDSDIQALKIQTSEISTLKIDVGILKEQIKSGFDQVRTDIRNITPIKK